MDTSTDRHQLLVVQWKYSLLAPLICFSFSDESSSSITMQSVFLRWKWARMGPVLVFLFFFFLSGCLTGWLSGVRGLVGAAAACAVGRLVGRSVNGRGGRPEVRVW
jgi:hypothetical protein